MQHLLSLLQNALDNVKEGKIDTALTLILAENTFAHDTEFLQCSYRWKALQKEKRDGVIKDYAHLENDIARSLIQILQTYIKERETQILPDFPSMNPDLLDKEGFLWGRKSELEGIESAYKAGKDIVLLHGIGGIGKTTLLLAYANRAEAKARFTTRIWIDIQEMPAEPTAETDLLLDSLIAYFRSPLALTGKSKTEQQVTIQQYFLHLGKATLLVLDNFNEQQQLQKSIAWLRSLHISVLISSRAEIENVKSIPITALSDEASLSAFKAFNPTPYPHETLTALLAALQHHPLLIELCAKHLRKKRSLQLPTLIEAANKADLSCLTTTHFTTKRDTYIEKSIADFLIDLFPFTQLTAAEQQMLRYFSLLSPRPYSLDALMELFGSLSDSRNELTQETETTAIDELLSNLKNLGWLEEQIAENENSPTFLYQCHPLIRYAVKEQLKPNAENCRTYFQTLAEITDYDAHKNPITQSKYLPDLLTALTYLQEDDALKADTYRSMQYLYQVRGNYTQALTYGLTYLHLAEKLYSETDTQLATAYNNIALIYEKLGNYEQSLSYNKKAIAIKEKVLGSEHHHLAVSYNNIASTYVYLGAYEQALSYAQKAITIWEKTLDAEDIFLVTTYNNIAIIYKNLRDYEQSLNYSKKVIIAREKILGKNHPSVAISYNNISITYRYLGDYKQALNYVKKSIVIGEKILDAEHPELATAYNNIAITYRYLGDYNESLYYYKKSITIREKVLGVEHPDLATSYNNIAITYTYLADWKNSLAFAKKAVVIAVKVYQKNHPYRKGIIDTMKYLLIEAKDKVAKELLAEYEKWLGEVE